MIGSIKSKMWLDCETQKMDAAWIKNCEELKCQILLVLKIMKTQKQCSYSSIGFSGSQTAFTSFCTVYQYYFCHHAHPCLFCTHLQYAYTL